MEFKAWPKIPRVSNKKEIYTEKIDGTNACIVISPYTEGDEQQRVFIDQGLTLRCQSRTRFITPENDNFGFARWAYSNGTELIVGLGEGHHYGEWWGSGIQRGYGQEEKIFSLFNTRRWGPHNPNTPTCVRVVPTIHKNSLSEAREFLVENGSLAAPGFMNVEGIVVYEVNTQTLWKEIIYK